MADATPTQATEGTTTPTTEDIAGFSPITTQEQLDAYSARIRKAEAAKYERYSEYKDAAGKLKEIEDAKRSELDKMQERAEAAEAKAAALEQAQQLEVWRREVASETGIAPELLRGASKEELAEHARDLASYLKPSAAPRVPSDGKKPGASPLTTAEQFAQAVGYLS